MGGIFISYRRSDVSGYAHALQAQLERRLGPDKLFIDVDSIKPGQDFVEEIEKALDSSSVLLVLIGKRWLQPERLQDPHDFVRLEITLAIERRKRIIPVLLEGATMPKPEDLPDSIRPLTRRQAFEISDLRFNSDTDRLIELLTDISSKPPIPSEAPTSDPIWQRAEKGLNPRRRTWIFFFLSLVIFLLDGGFLIAFSSSFLKGYIPKPQFVAWSFSLGLAALITCWDLFLQARRGSFSFPRTSLVTTAQIMPIIVAGIFAPHSLGTAIFFWGFPSWICLALAAYWRTR